jgi:nucleoside-diphosphate-sugar epimerase
MRVLVTGATGFVGRALVPMLTHAGHDVTITVRYGPSADHLNNVRLQNIGEIGPETNWQEALKNIYAVIHLAGRAHVMTESEPDPLAAYRRINRDGTKRLAEAAADAGVKRLVFLSSIKVNGERTSNQPYSESAIPQPEDAYGQSKWEGEQALRDIPGLETVVVRTPLVYGPHVKGNFRSLLNICAKALPLPLGHLQNRRSLIYVGNLADALITCLTHAKATGNLYLVRDGDDVSTTALINSTAQALGKPARLFPVPGLLLRVGGALTGKSGMVSRLIESLEIDDSAIRRDLDWTPPFTMVQGLTETATWYKSLK